ncbi:MAG: hypothetical protein RSE58_06245 [Clostridia bacterium]
MRKADVWYPSRACPQELQGAERKAALENCTDNDQEPACLVEPGAEYPAQLGRPEVEDCGNGAIPYKVEPMSDAEPMGKAAAPNNVASPNSAALTNDSASPNVKKKILVPVLKTMTKYLFDHYRLSMYSYVNRCLREGTLSRVVGARVLNKVINHDALSFPHVSFWRIDRTDFYADVQAELKLETMAGELVWNGYLVFLCSFTGEFSCIIERLTDEVNRENDGLDPMNPYLVPYYNNKRMDEVTEEIWKRYCPKALNDPKARDAKKLAELMGLRVEYHPVYDHHGVGSILFFSEDDLAIGQDRSEKDWNGVKKRVKDAEPTLERIPADTIVINTNLLHRDYSAFDIFHECVHYEEHYMTFRLQELASNDPRKTAMKEIDVTNMQEVTDPIYFMEKQANRGAYGLLMPVTYMRELIAEECREVEKYRHAGEKYEIAGKQIAAKLRLPHFRIRARMIQLGNIEAKGALNYVQRKLIQPFAFDLDAWREEQYTFVIDYATAKQLYHENDDFRVVMDSGRYIYADGHIVRNGQRFVIWEEDKLILTDWANAHVDDCCLRFIRIYVQENAGRYVFGRMYCDTDYVKQTRFYLNDLIIKENLDELDAKTKYIQTFPKSFKDTIEQLKQQNAVSNIKLAEFLNMDDSTFGRSIGDPKRYMNEDYLTVLCLYFRLPDWISRLVFKRAHFQLDEENKRHQAILHILRVQSNDGLEAANEYLIRNNLAPLRI